MPCYKSFQPFNVKILLAEAYFLFGYYSNSPEETIEAIAKKTKSNILVVKIDQDNTTSKIKAEKYKLKYSEYYDSVTKEQLYAPTLIQKLLRKKLGDELYDNIYEILKQKIEKITTIPNPQSPIPNPQFS